MSFLTKEQILNADDLKFVELEVPEWGGTVRIKTLTAGERDRLESIMFPGGDTSKVNTKNVRALVASLAIVDDKGERLFSEKEIGELAKKSAKAMDRVFTAAQELNGITKKDIEDMEGNLKPDPADYSSSD
jgi:hypothetical protein